jgi:hypothetical protein
MIGRQAVTRFDLHPARLKGLISGIDSHREPLVDSELGWWWLRLILWGIVVDVLPPLSGTIGLGQLYSGQVITKGIDELYTVIRPESIVGILYAEKWASMAIDRGNHATNSVGRKAKAATYDPVIVDVGSVLLVSYHSHSPQGGYDMGGLV